MALNNYAGLPKMFGILQLSGGCLKSQTNSVVSLNCSQLSGFQNEFNIGSLINIIRTSKNYIVL